MEQLSPNLHYLTTAHIDVCSADLEIHPAIIIGKLAYEKRASYKILGIYNEDSFNFLPKATIVK